MVMIYEYLCQKCNLSWEVWKPVSEMTLPESCTACGEHGERLVTGGAGFFGAKVEDASYDPAFGCIVKGSDHRKQLAKQRGMIEIGNEKPETIAREMDKTREGIREAHYAEAMKP